MSKLNQAAENNDIEKLIELLEKDADAKMIWGNKIVQLLDKYVGIVERNSY